MEQSTKITCPKCNSDQISAQKKGFSAGKAVVGGVVTGGVGLLAGLHGKDKIEVYCLACGCKWRPKDYLAKKTKHEKEVAFAKKEDLKKEFSRLYKVDRGQAEVFAKNNGLLNRQIPDIDKLNKSITTEKIGGGIVLVAFVVFVIWLIYECSSAS